MDNEAVEQPVEKDQSEGLRRFFEMNPTLVRGLLVSVAALLASIFGRILISNELIEAIVQTFIAISGLVTALWARNQVIAEKKVVAWKPDPDANVVMPGPAATDADLLGDSAALSMTQAEVRQVLNGDI